ncbi:MAG: acyltransferase [Clostridia bacterium]|nr:acyltransferase [Clostridia bacterium]
MYNLFESISILVLYIVLAAGFKKSAKGEFHEDFMSLKVTKGLQGFAAVGIMLHHLVQSITKYGEINYGPLNLFNDVGVLFAGMFFFFSGYGLMVSLETKPNYLDTFVKKRFPVILIPFYLVNLIFVVCNGVFNNLFIGEAIKPGEVMLALSGFVLMNTHLWFIVEICVLYVLFYIIFRLIKNRNAAYAVMGICTVALIIISVLLGHDYESFSGGVWFKGEWWYNTTILFFIGMTIAKFKDAVFAAVKKHYAVFMTVGFVLFAVLFVLTRYVMMNHGYYTETEVSMGYADKFITLIVQTLMAAAGILFFMMLTMKLQFSNKILDFLGKISMELYMLHNLFIMTMTDGMQYADVNHYLITIYGCAILAAVALHFIGGKILKSIKE